MVAAFYSRLLRVCISTPFFGRAPWCVESGIRLSGCDVDFCRLAAEKQQRSKATDFSYAVLRVAAEAAAEVIVVIVAIVVIIDVVTVVIVVVIGVVLVVIIVVVTVMAIIVVVVSCCNGLVY